MRQTAAQPPTAPARRRVRPGRHARDLGIRGPVSRVRRAAAHRGDPAGESGCRGV